jgi:hypothetical protein
MSDDVVENLKQPSQWLRIAFMLALAVALYVTSIILTLVVATQAIFSLLTGKDNQNLREFGFDLTAYVQDILRFLTYNSEFKPFPFSSYSRQADQFTSSSADDSSTAESMAADDVVAEPDKADTAASTSAKRAAPRKRTSKAAPTSQTKPRASTRSRKPAARKTPNADTENNVTPSG